MSTPSRIVLISKTLRAHLLAGFAAPDWSAATPLVCDKVAASSVEENAAGTLWVLLYHVAHNTSLRNELPTRLPDAGGSMQRPALVLDLHYLLAAQAADAALSEALLEQACMRLHMSPMLPASEGQRTDVTTCNPVPLSPAELITLWKGFGQPLRPALAYRITTSIAPPAGAPPLPILTRPQP